MPSTEERTRDGQRVDRSRRTVLLAVGAATALTGCLGDDGGSDRTPTEQSDPTSTPDPNDGTPTPEPDGEQSTPDRDDGSERDGGREGLSRAEARELLPPQALAFRYQPPMGTSVAEFWAAVVGETDATAVRVEAASGTSNEIQPQDGRVTGYLGVPVQVDTDGDEVTVFAVDDTGASGPVTTVDVPTDALTSEAARDAVPPEALSFAYKAPDAGDYGTLAIEVTSETGADTLVAQPLEAPGLFADRVGDLRGEAKVGTGTTLEVGVDPDGDEVVVSASVDGATGEVTRWQGPD